MRHLILTDENGGEAVLTTESPASSYGVPVLQITADDVDGDFGPADLIGDPDKGIPLMTAASIVAPWGSQPERTAAERQAARQFCAQWPEGPQVQA